MGEMNEEVEVMHNHYLFGGKDNESLQFTISATYASGYMGFTFNNKHSSELGIVRISEGNRFNEDLFPTIQDKTAQIPGADGSYFFGSYFTQKVFNISFAFDSLTEKQLAELKAHFGDKKIHDLIFDETPYKKYRAKVTGSATFKFIPFSEGATNRVYKGEGTLQFTAYNPYARSVAKYLDQYTNSNIEEWKDAAGLLETQGDYDKLIDNIIKLYNPGVRDTDFVITFNFDENGKIPAGYIDINGYNRLSFKEILSQNGDTQIKISSRLNLIEGYIDGKKTGRIYNQYITKGSFFKIPMRKDAILTIDATNNLPKLFADIEYDYIYF